MEAVVYREIGSDGVERRFFVVEAGQVMRADPCAIADKERESLGRDVATEVAGGNSRDKQIRGAVAVRGVE